MGVACRVFAAGGRISDRRAGVGGPCGGGVSGVCGGRPDTRQALRGVWTGAGMGEGYRPFECTRHLGVVALAAAGSRSG